MYIYIYIYICIYILDSRHVRHEESAQRGSTSDACCIDKLIDSISTG